MFKHQISWFNLQYLLVFFSVVKGQDSMEMSTKRPNGSSDSDEFDHKIVGGRPAKPGEAPYQISLGVNYEHVCGASLVVNSKSGLQYGITAAHCVTDSQRFKPNRYPEEYYVRAGSVNRDRGQTLTLNDVVVHPGWTGENENDIALLFFRGEFVLSDELYPIDLPDSPQQDQVSEIVVSGWGALQEGSYDLPTNLQIVKLPVVNRRACNYVYSRLYQKQNVIKENVICAGYREGGKDSCQGDSGGPAVALDKRGKYLVGIVSFGDGCARPDTPGVYTRVSKYLDFIQYVVSRFGGGPFMTRGQKSSKHA